MITTKGRQEKYGIVTEKSCNLYSTICITVTYDTFAETRDFYVIMYTQWRRTVK